MKDPCGDGRRGLNRTLLFLRTLALNTVFYAGIGYLPFLVPTPVTPILLDDYIGFQPFAVYPYLSFFFMIWYAIASAERQEEAEDIAIIIPSTAFLASLIFLTFPMHVIAPPFDMSGSDTVTRLLYDLMKADTSLTYLPSLHGAISAICVYYLSKGKSLPMQAFFWVWGLCICWSAISLRQHLSVDILAGVAFGVLTLWGRGLILRVVRNRLVPLLDGVRLRLARTR